MYKYSVVKDGKVFSIRTSRIFDYGIVGIDPASHTLKILAWAGSGELAHQQVLKWLRKGFIAVEPLKAVGQV